MTTATKTKPKTNAFGGLGNLLGKEFDASLLAGEGKRSMFKLADIDVTKQVREEFEDEEQTLADLAESMDQLQLAPVILRKNVPGSDKPYLLVAGGRRFMAAELAKWTEIWGDYHPDMTDEVAGRIQFQENIHRKNLTLQEEARRVQRDLEELGTVDAVLAKYKKNRSWLSKILGMLNLPKQAGRLVRENVTADVDLINTVRQVEKVDPERAEQLVNTLKEGKGVVNARDLANSVKDEVKPSKKKAAAKQTGSVATPKDKSHEAPGPASVVKALGRNASSPEELLARLYTAIREKGMQPKAAFEAMKTEDKKIVTDWLQSYFDNGAAAKDIGVAVVSGFEERMFAPDADGVVNLVAFLNGAKGAKFSVLTILGALKQR